MLAQNLSTKSDPHQLHQFVCIEAWTRPIFYFVVKIDRLIQYLGMKTIISDSRNSFFQFGQLNIMRTDDSHGLGFEHLSDQSLRSCDSIFSIRSFEDFIQKKENLLTLFRAVYQLFDAAEFGIKGAYTFSEIIRIAHAGIKLKVCKSESLGKWPQAKIRQNTIDSEGTHKGRLAAHICTCEQDYLVIFGLQEVIRNCHLR